MGREVAVRTDGSRGMMSIDLNKVNYGASKLAIDKYIKSVGGSTNDREQNFPGTQLTFKQGEWFSGFGDSVKLVKTGAEFVFNVPNMMAGWQTWEEIAGKTNKKGEQLRLPKYTEMTFPAAGDDPIERESLGQLDQSEWETDSKGKVQDPWKPTLVFPIRKAGSEEVHHVLLTTVSSCIAGFNLFRDIIEEMKLHPGELPLVSIGTKKTSMDKMENVKGKQKKVKYTWDVPTFEVTGWTDAIDADNPAKDGGVRVTDSDDAADLGEVETKQRVKQTAKKANGKSNGKAIAAPSKGTAKPANKTRKAIEVDDEDTL